MPTFTNILVAIDDSPAAEHAASVAVDLVAERGGKLTFGHVADEGLVRASQDPNAVEDRLRDEGAALLASAVARAAERGVSAETELATGDIVQEFLAIAARRRPDLIVTGTSARHGLARLMLGSVAEGFLHGTEVPVLIVRA
jgi:nucleotide-binding universal stress UspA family protein